MGLINYQNCSKPKLKIESILLQRMYVKFLSIPTPAQKQP